MVLPLLDSATLLFDCNLQQIVSCSTHIVGHTLDLVLPNIYDDISDLRIDSQQSLGIKSDHFPLHFLFILSYTHQNLCPLFLTLQFVTILKLIGNLYLHHFDFFF